MTDPLVHPHKELTTPAGDQVNIDLAMVPLIETLWSRGLTTTACCQDVGEATRAVRDAQGITEGYMGEDFIAYYTGWALLKMPWADALRLLAALRTVPAFAARIEPRWQEQSWRMNVPIIYGQGLVDLAPDAMLHFPSAQIPELAQTLTSIDVRP
ncbi:hypothetical protein [Streptomyces sp. NPDC086776]|uniref:hypothetical protein n=1 Tax=Streptomyces sp. NPDC086776 TaxID=3365756 RepID=UPI0038181865